MEVQCIIDGISLNGVGRHDQHSISLATLSSSAFGMVICCGIGCAHATGIAISSNMASSSNDCSTPLDSQSASGPIARMIAFSLPHVRTLFCRCESLTVKGYRCKTPILKLQEGSPNSMVTCIGDQHVWLTSQRTGKCDGVNQLLQ
eukprot:GHVN01088416.1.p2 GENE.GHVN01088416.1~~GHVN01088416.1.p2  ORF type:complete len:146 (-),score=7.09 GHVN01088416.1:108-545(-)